MYSHELLCCSRSLKRHGPVNNSASPWPFPDLYFTRLPGLPEPQHIIRLKASADLRKGLEVMAALSTEEASACYRKLTLDILTDCGVRNKVTSKLRG